ncbi:MAG: hydrolase [Ezakiella sp.]|nr:hydrolase [Ezakiella sp.]
MDNEKLELKSEEKKKKFIPSVDTVLRRHVQQVPEATYRASGINIMGRRIKSLVFSTDVAIIRNTNAEAVMAVYPFTPELSITKAILEVASIPVFVGVGGGLTTGTRSIEIAFQAELHGAFGVVVNAPMKNDVIKNMSEYIDIPVVATVASLNDDIMGKIRAGARILNVAGGKKTPELLREVRKIVGDEFPIIATGGHSQEHIIETVNAGANCLSYTPKTSPELLEEIMQVYREK